MSFRTGFVNPGRGAFADSRRSFSRLAKGVTRIRVVAEVGPYGPNYDQPRALVQADQEHGDGVFMFEESPETARDFLDRARGLRGIPVAFAGPDGREYDVLPAGRIRASARPGFFDDDDDLEENPAPVAAGAVVAGIAALGVLADRLLTK